MKEWAKILLGLWTACCLAACGANDATSAQRYYEEGRALRQEGEVVQAMQQFVAATQTRTNDFALLGRTYSNMANMCRQAERHDLAFEVYSLSAEQFLRANDTLAFAYALNNMAWEQAVQGNKPDAVVLVDSALRICTREEVQTKVLESLAASSLYAEEYDSTLFYTARMHGVYGRMLRAQAFCLLDQCDSAIQYARQVVSETDNPRYLDDAYYILAHCDSTENVNEILDLTSARTDVQRELEQQKIQLTQAIMLMEQSLKGGNPKDPKKIVWWTLFATLCVAVGVLLFRKLRKPNDRTSQLKKTCRSLAKVDAMKTELRWNDYDAFCRACDERFFGLADKLTKRGLSEREIRLCLLVLIGFSYAEMADILHRAQNGIGKDKYTIAKKLNVTVKDLQATLRNIACQEE